MLQRSFRLVLLDNRGSGRSAAAAGAFSVSDMCADVVAVLDHIGVGMAHILGASLGGMVAQDLAVTHPDRVDRLVLACTTPGWPFAYPMPAPFVRLIGAIRRLPDGIASRRLVEGALSTSTVAQRPELVDLILMHQGSAARDRQAIWSEQAKAGARYAGHFRQRRIRARTLILHGSADRVVDPRNARLLADRIESAELRIFPGLGHLFYWEDPDGFAATVTDFLLGSSVTSARVF
jgi:pimeloyl-ACP methyl ester carboxylesterase